MEKFEIKNRKGLKIIGDLLIPSNPKGLSFVLHGLGGFKEQRHMEILTKTLLNNGYITVNFDATNSIGESEGKYEDATMQNHYEDLADVINWAKTQEWYKEPFILTGHSLGGFAVAKYAEEYPNEVKAVFPYAAVYSGQDSIEAHKRFNPEELKEWEETGWKTRISNSKPGTEMKLPWSHIEERLTHDLKLKADKLTMSVLFVVGENDTSCPPDQQLAFCDLLPTETKKEIHLIAGAPHTFKEQDHLNQLQDIFNNWIKTL